MAPLPSGFKTREEYNEYMRKYLPRYRQKLKLKASKELRERMHKTKEFFLEKAEFKLLYSLFSTVLKQFVLTDEFRKWPLEKQKNGIRKAWKEIEQMIAPVLKELSESLDQQIAQGISEIEADIDAARFDETISEILKEEIKKGENKR